MLMSLAGFPRARARPPAPSLSVFSLSAQGCQRAVGCHSPGSAIRRRVRESDPTISGRSVPRNHHGGDNYGILLVPWLSASLPAEALSLHRARLASGLITPVAGPWK